MGALTSSSAGLFAKADGRRLSRNRYDLEEVFDAVSDPSA